MKAEKAGIGGRHFVKKAKKTFGGRHRKTLPAPIPNYCIITTFIKIPSST
jgi:hypothetical protein